ncbi:hypothetical protein [Pseudomonas benzenivorans]|uniref:Ribosomal protein L7/L12 C-terminal domain-containing protein n=1 Tax=Pseudomonas benzenivorans TaxID=556533 RepID=A0ABY5HBX4_9PSED|nr:hypothetical protein [Pseudomonas benzenivorans]UTW08852.1 hypothetical protein KDW96_05925 [Pseudomonas benzenivorans]
MSQQQDDMPAEVVAALKEGHKIEAIKRLRESRGLDLREAKAEVEAYLHDHPELFAAARGSGRRHGLLFWLLLSLLLGVLLLLFSHRL